MTAVTLGELALASPIVAYGTSLPGSPADGALAILVDSTSNPTYQWLFRYNAAEATYGWECIGGTPKVAVVSTTETAGGTANQWQDLATTGPTFTLPLAGDYLLRWTATLLTGGNGDYSAVGVAVGATSPFTHADTTLSSGSEFATLFSEYRADGMSASDALRLRYFCANRTDNTFQKRRLIVMPIRVTT
jgi:hypothetical protein